jgi:hypothetical protein
LSSAILYLAIVAIWAAVLMPRWLRSHPADADPAGEGAEPQRSPNREDTLASPAATVEPVATVDPVATVGPVAQDPAGGPPAPAPAQGAAWQPGAPVPARAASLPGEPGRGPGTSRGPGTARGPETGRTRILRARRRMLATLVVLTAGAAAIAQAHLAASWVVIPPGLTLAGFLLLLREAAHSDAQRSRRTLARQAGEVAPARAAARPGAPVTESWEYPAGAGPGLARPPVPEPAPDLAPEPELTAQVIDLPQRAGDQVYDQYADAAERAVGD